MFKLTKQPVATIALSSATGLVGARTTTKLVNATQSHRVMLTFAASITVAAAPITAWRNRASCLAMISQVGIMENGRDRVVLEGRDLRALSEVFSPSALSATRPTAVIAGTYLFRETCAINFAHPFSVSPRETAFLERDPQQPLELFATLASDWIARICDAGGATVTLNSFTVTARQIHDPFEQALPYFLPSVRQFSETIAAANTQYLSYIRSPNYIRGMLIAQDTNVGETNDIIVGLALRDDFRAIIGPAQVPWDDLARDAETEFGGLVYPATAAAQAYCYLDFQKYGRLPGVINPAQTNNLRLEMNVTPSVLAGATSSRVRITLLELEKDTTVMPSGRRLVDPNPPFDI